MLYLNIILYYRARKMGRVGRIEMGQNHRVPLKNIAKTGPILDLLTIEKIKGLVFGD
jgi:hypothetical protein